MYGVVSLSHAAKFGGSERGVSGSRTFPRRAAFSDIEMSYFDFVFPAFLDFFAARARARIFFITLRSAADILITLRQYMKSVEKPTENFR